MLRAEAGLSLEVWDMEGFWVRRRQELPTSSREKCLKECLQCLGPLSMFLELRTLREPR